MNDWSLSVDAREILDETGRCVCRFPNQAEGGLPDAERLRAMASALMSPTVHYTLKRLLAHGSWHDDGTWVYEPRKIEGLPDVNAIEELAHLSGS